MALCRICTGKAEFFASAQIMRKYTVEYFRCATCGAVQTEEPYWLDEAYRSAINESDIGLLARNLSLVGPTRAVVSAFFAPDGSFLDYGGGYGTFVRLMRDRGYDFRYYDKHCATNLFAKGHEFDPEQETAFELATAFEVFEHLVTPRVDISQILHFSNSVLFTTQLLPQGPPKPEEWWYYGLDHGQHITFYTERSLSMLASSLSLDFLSDGKGLHLFTDRKVDKRVFSLISKGPGMRLVNFFNKRESLLGADYLRLTGKSL